MQLNDATVEAEWLKHRRRIHVMKLALMVVTVAMAAPPVFAFSVWISYSCLKLALGDR